MAPAGLRRTQQPGFRPGELLRVPVGDGAHTYGRFAAASPYVAFYDCRAEAGDPPVLEIVRSSVLFVLATMYAPAVKSGRWTRLPGVPLETVDIQIPLFWHHPVGAPDRLSIVDQAGRFRPATPAECRGLEMINVWVPAAVEQRLQHHYAGRADPSVRIFGVEGPRRTV